MIGDKMDSIVAYSSSYNSRINKSINAYLNEKSSEELNQIISNHDNKYKPKNLIARIGINFSEFFVSHPIEFADYDAAKLVIKMKSLGINEFAPKTESLNDIIDELSILKQKIKESSRAKN
jgi:hypothetical protein